MATKTASRKKSKPAKKEAPNPIDPIAPNEVAPLPADEFVEEAAPEEAEPAITGSIEGEFPEKEVRGDVALVVLVDGKLPKLASGEQFFESPDGRIYSGPADQHSIPDPENPRTEINPMRLGGMKR